MIPIVGRSCQIVGRLSGLTCSHCQTTSRLRKNTSQPTNSLLKTYNFQLCDGAFLDLPPWPTFRGWWLMLVFASRTSWLFRSSPIGQLNFCWGMLPFSTWVANRVFTLSPFRTYSSPQSPTSFFSLWGWKYQGGVPTALTLKIQPKNVLNVRENCLRMARFESTTPPNPPGQTWFESKKLRSFSGPLAPSHTSRPCTKRLQSRS